MRLGFMYRIVLTSRAAPPRSAIYYVPLDQLTLPCGLLLKDRVQPLIVAADARSGRPGSAGEAMSGDGAVAWMVGSDDDVPVLAEWLGGASDTVGTPQLGPPIRQGLARLNNIF